MQPGEKPSRDHIKKPYWPTVFFFSTKFCMRTFRCLSNRSSLLFFSREYFRIWLASLREFRNVQSSIMHRFRFRAKTRGSVASIAKTFVDISPCALAEFSFFALKSFRSCKFRLKIRGVSWVFCLLLNVGMRNGASAENVGFVFLRV